jgi:DNA-directed RNA polymerase subunit alpha
MPSTLDLSGLVLPESAEEQSRSDDGRRAEYLLQPLERGFGHTIGNSIRRILLSSLPGASVWAFRVDGVQHEHQTIEGVAEDIHQIIQNLKKLVIRLDPGVDEARLELSVHEAGPVTAADIGAASAVEIVNPDQHLFTLQTALPENRPLRMDLWVNRGRGFAMAEQHAVPKEAPVDLIRVDSLYNPVIKANFTVQETRVGQRTDFDRLAIAVETNGALDPADALGQAARIARAHLDYLTRIGEGPIEILAGEEGAVAGGDGAPEGLRRVGPELQELLEQSLEAFEGISVRSRNTLEKADIRTLGDVASRSRDDMLKVENFGEKSLEEVAEVLAANKLHFGMALECGEDGTLYLREEASAGNGAAAESEGDDEA